MISIQEVNRKNRLLVILVIISVVLTSLAWIGDIFSWAWIGNGFIIDIILFFVAGAMTFGTISIIYYRRKIKAEESTFLIKDDNFIYDTKTIVTNTTSFSCLNCGSMLQIDNDLCSSCGSLKPVCIVCFSSLKQSEEIVKLVCCSVYAHKEHILNYIDVRGRCPKCDQILLKNQLEIVHF